MAIMARMLSRKTFVLGVLVVALFMVVSTFAGTSRAEQLVASWYGVGDGFAGRDTANGETFDPYAYTAAHKELPFGTKLAVTYEGRTAVVRINDRGPYIEGRDLDLSYAAADYIGLTAAGSAPVNVEYVDGSTPVGPYEDSAVQPAPEPEPEPAPAPAPEPAPELQAAPEPEQQFASEPSESPEPESPPEQVEPEQVEPEQEGGFFGLQAPSGEPAQSVEDGQYGAEGDQYEESEDVDQTRGRQAAEDQYEGRVLGASGDQYVSEDQYDDGSDQAAPAPQGMPEPPAPPQPSPATVAPEVSELEEPPAELVKPGSTVEHRIELNIAAAPGTATESPDTPDPAPAPTTESAGAGAAPDAESPGQPVEPEGDQPRESGEPESGEPEGDATEDQDSGEVEIERLPDTGGWVQIPRPSPADLVAVLLVAFVLKSGLHRIRA